MSRPCPSSRLPVRLLLLLALLPAAALAADDGAGDRVRPEAGEAQTTAPTVPVTPAGKEDPELEPGHDLEGGPRGEGEDFRRFTYIGEAELRAVDPTFRGWVERIRNGLADKRIMRLYHYYRHRLEPLDELLSGGWRQEAAGVLRDAGRTAEAVRRFEGRAAGPRRGDPAVSPTGSAAGAFLRESGAGEDTSVSAAGISPRGVWKPIGPFTIPGRMTGLDRPKNEPNTLYAAAADGGIWRTRDAGATWETLTDFEETLSGGSVLLDPTDPDVIYFGTGEGNNALDNYAGIGVLKSTDGGQTWTKSNNFSSIVRALAMHGSNPSRIWAAGSQGCYLSDDAGATFSLLSGGGLPGSGSGADVIVRRNDADTVYCAIWDDGIYRTEDAGSSWSRLDSGLPVGGTGRIHLAIHRANPDIMIAAMAIGNGRLYRSLDGGDTWNEIPGSYQGFCGGQCWYDMACGIDPEDPDVIYAAGINSYHTLDGGLSWSQMSSSAGGHGAPDYVHVDQHEVFTPASGEVFLANDGGIYRSTNSGVNWIEWSQGMDTTQYYGICRKDFDPYWSFGGTQDNGSHRRRLSDDWKQVLGADGGMCMTGPGSVIVGEYQNTNLRRSANGGGSWAGANDGIGSGEPRPWVGIMVSDPSDRNNMYVGTSRVYRSMDAKATAWVGISSAALFYGRPVSTLAVAPSDSNVVYAGFELGGLFRTTNALDASPAWTDIRDGSWDIRTIRRVRVHPDDPDTAYAVHAGLTGNRVFKTVDGGSTWVNHTGDLPVIPVNDLVVDADNPGTLIAATDLGVFRSDDDGTTWYGFSTGLPTAAAIEFTHDRTGDVLRIGTHGRSIWEWQEASDTPVAVPNAAGIAGAPLRVAKLVSGDLRITWDVRSCTAMDYNVFHGDLDQVASLTYDGAACAVGTSGLADVADPSTASGNAFFILASTDGLGTDGPHGEDGDGQVRSASGVGLCGLTAQDLLATCP